MPYFQLVRRIFRLFLVWLKTTGQEREILKQEIDQLLNQMRKSEHDDIPDDIKKRISDLFRYYADFYKSDGLVEKYEAEERIMELLQELRHDSKLNDEEEKV